MNRDKNEQTGLQPRGKKPDPTKAKARRGRGTSTHPAGLQRHNKIKDPTQLEGTAGLREQTSSAGLQLDKPQNWNPALNQTNQGPKHGRKGKHQQTTQTQLDSSTTSRLKNPNSTRWDSRTPAKTRVSAGFQLNKETPTAL